MAELSLNSRAIIANYPLKNSLDCVRDSLQEAEQSYKSDLAFYDGSADTPDQTWQETISRLLLALMGEKAAFNLHLQSSNRDVASELSTLFARVRKGDFEYGHYCSLSRLVIQKAPDVDIWNAVLNLIVTVSQSTPLVSIHHSFDGTPMRSTSSSQKGPEQTRRLVEARIFEEIRTCTFRSVEGFFAKYFEGRDWSGCAEVICQRVLDASDGKWAKFPDPPVQDKVLDWWLRFQDNLLSEARNVYFTTTTKNDLIGLDAERQVDLLLKAKDEGGSSEKHAWKDVQVVGELKQSEQEIRAKSTLLQIGRYVRDVFSAQPTRRFVHAFTVCGTKMEAWVFDRSGPYSSGILDIYQDAKRFFQVIVGYAMMSDEELGLDTFITQNAEGGKMITVETAETEAEMVLQLDPAPLCFQQAIVCRGTSCFLAKSGDEVEGVAKFSWTSDKRQPEVDLLKLAHQRGVKGVAKVIGHCAITSITSMRDSLSFDKCHNFRSAASSASSSVTQSQPHNPLSRSASNLRGLGISEKPTRKRRSPDARTLPPKRSRSSSQQSKNDQQDNELAFTVQSVQRPSLFDKNEEEPYDNRILRCLVISPAGQPIYEFNSPVELLLSLRDAIKAHQSLYLDGNILHRDISENNIIITDPKNTDGNSGMLIDLDLAKEVGTRSGARHQTGTMEFMAIEVLLNVDHTYRHDLESFFYVLIWQCARHGWMKFNQLHKLYQLQDRPKDSMLKEWYTGNYEKIATYKRGNMEAGGFERILMKEFPPWFDCIKPLCRAIRDILFPYNDRGLIVGTPQDPKCLYDPIIKAYDATIAELNLESNHV
ncbi:hypothetical protein GX50_01375 [[Emmonsia] crescens]|uniref:EKC/KEOPS complex subunit BUD32 n=1 Tax=[Emmonsia] crescens TaxID=73230 RepID=A0A2B7ZQY3_9EURO|nr:hypothetical protein GX50_01375 [Emmonsia crescens]